MRIVDFGRSYIRITGITPPIVLGDYSDKELNGIVWSKILEDDFKNKRYGFTYF